MINFIVCDDNKIINERISLIIDNIMMKNKLAYKKHLFYDFDEKFISIIKEDLTSKIYILDIETPSGSGIEMARIIREKDIDSIIIFITVHQELGNILLKDELMFLTFICKFDNLDLRIESAIKNALKMVGVKQALRFLDHGILYTIPFDDILYITTNTLERKTIIVTNSVEFQINKNLYEIASLLDYRFIQTHRSCYINKNRVLKINKKNNEIVFDTSKQIYLLSNTYKKGLE